MVYGSPGGWELSRIIGLALFVSTLFLLTRRRQHDAWTSGVQLAIVMFGATWISGEAESSCATDRPERDAV